MVVAAVAFRGFRINDLSTTERVCALHARLFI